ncbi:hypothetical protein [Megalodesulfovibrio gigas]|uniref:Uncharacterized protein n=1 Tax=Megalodesulfovibrio gigas (strain ATCC 19364 / DSM 1382 / NCIMB 9332 / VKM B-1759) TaxID=1121448 RepID=T2GD52_MEGG1|nr:hypothetical protein [Megalodesulfovibrio gigas]AGW13847.1 hypothetical protein DGI_2080 [Megalodesulfovibrio gigas DSM 1382 = ATCC 19364]
MAKKISPENKKQVMESKYDPIKLRQLCEAGVTAMEAKQALGLSSMQSLRQHLMRLSVESQNLMTLPGLYERSSTRARLTKQGIKLSLSKLKASGIEYPENTEFRMEFDEERNQILLTWMGIGTGQVDQYEPSDISNVR